MSETVNFADFKLKTQLDLSVIADDTEQRRRFYAPTDHDVKLADGTTEQQHLPVYVTIPQNIAGPEIIVRLPAWSDDNGRPEGAIFDAYLAEANRRIVVAPNAPGVDYSAWRSVDNRMRHGLSEVQTRDLRKGSFASVGGAVMRATQHATKLAMSDGRLDAVQGEAAALLQSGKFEFILSGSSMAAGLLSGATRRALEEGIPLAGLNIEEAVNLRPRGFKRLMGSFVLANAAAGKYLSQNPEDLNEAGESKWHWLKRVNQSRVANSLYAHALAAGKFYDDLGNASDLSAKDADIPVWISHGGASRLSPAQWNLDLWYHLVSQGVNAGSKEYLGHDHAYTMAVGSLEDVADRVLELAA